MTNRTIRKRWQWSLRAFLAFSTIVAVVLGIWIKWFTTDYTAEVELMGQTTAGAERPLPPPPMHQVMWAISQSEIADERLPDGFKSSEMKIEKLNSYSDPPKFMPLIGPSIRNHQIFHCTLIGKAGGKIIHHSVNIDQNHFHMISQSELDDYLNTQENVSDVTVSNQ
jgi:hypothetical protein